MLKIAHRGNLNGPNSALENSPEYIQKALDLGYYVEIDCWKIAENWWLGHNGPKYLVDFEFINNGRIFAHCKNLEALYQLGIEQRLKCDFFAHDQDPWALTNFGYIWTYPGEKVTKKSIIVDLENFGKYNDIAGICSDFWNAR